MTTTESNNLVPTLVHRPQLHLAEALKRVMQDGDPTPLRTQTCMVREVELEDGTWVAIAGPYDDGRLATNNLARALEALEVGEVE